jgi:hypothetical protein
MKKIRSWAIVVEWVRDNEQWDTETITDVDPDTSAVVDDFLTEYENQENQQ